MKKFLIGFLFFVIGFSADAQRLRTTATFDADTSTRPAAGFYGIGMRSNNVFVIPNAGTNVRLLAANSHIGVNGQFLFSNGSSNVWRTPVIADLTGLQTALDLKANLASPTFTGTVGGITKSMVGLGNVDNTSDLNKPISTATQTALNGKEGTIIAGTTAQYWRGDKSWQTLNTTNVVEGSNLYFTEARARATALTGYSVGANTALGTGDSFLDAFGKVQGQINARFTTPAGLTNNFVPKWNGSAFANTAISVFSDGNTMIGNNTYYGETRLGVFGGVNGANVDVRGNSGAFVDQATFEAEGADYDTQTRSTYLQYRGSTFTGTTNGFSNNNLARLVMNGDNNLIWSNLDKPIAFGTNNVERMRLLGNGNFGIGTASPSAKLDVAGIGRFTDYVSFNDQGYIRSSSGTLDLQGGSTSTRILNNAYNSTLVTFLNSGNVGIGTASPNYKLQIKVATDVNIGVGTGNDASAFRLMSINDANNANTPLELQGSTIKLFGNSGAFGLIVNASGNVGIGNTSPSAKLDILSSSNTVNQFRVASSDGATPSNRTYSTSDGDGLIINQVYAVGGSPYLRNADFVASTSDLSATQMRFFTKNTSSNPALALLISKEGNVGIGTATPAHKLDVSGTAQATAFKLAANNTAPATSTEACVVGEIRIDASHIYYCTGTNTWKRAALSTF